MYVVDGWCMWKYQVLVIVFIGMCIWVKGLLGTNVYVFFPVIGWEVCGLRLNQSWVGGRHGTWHWRTPFLTTFVHSCVKPFGLVEAATEIKKTESWQVQRGSLNRWKTSDLLGPVICPETNPRQHALPNTTYIQQDFKFKNSATASLRASLEKA